MGRIGQVTGEHKMGTRDSDREDGRESERNEGRAAEPVGRLQNDELERAVMLAVNEKLFQKGDITEELYSLAKERILMV